jgi:hypothetical protein
MARQQRLDLPLCGREGCENRVKASANFYCSYACISPEERRAWAREGQAKQVYLRRARRFSKIVDGLGLKPKRSDVLGALQTAYWMGMSAEASAVYRRKQAKV